MSDILIRQEHRHLNKQKRIEMKAKIPVTIKESWSGRGYTISIAPNLISHEKWENLGDNLSKSQIECRLKMKDTIKLYGLSTTQEMIDTANDVHCSSYRYSNGECQLNASTITDIQNWAKKFSDQIAIINN